MALEATWRWFGGNDPVSLTDIRQLGVEGIVTALHHIPNGAVWEVGAIKEHQKQIEAAGLYWSVVESIPVHEDIKTRSGNYKQYIQRYQETLINLATCGIDTVCYNFMPVLDWTRPHLAYRLPNGVKALKFDLVAFCAFDLFLLQRPKAAASYATTTVEAAENYYKQLGEEQAQHLTSNILAGLPVAEEGYTLNDFREKLATYDQIDDKKLRQHLYAFVEEIAPVAASVGIKLAIHPDDPPFPILGLPRVLSTEADAQMLLAQVNSPANGLCFCTGSYGVYEGNDLVGMAQRLASRIHFIHLRSTKRDEIGSFYEADHLEGDVDMYGVMKALLAEQIRRKQVEVSHTRMPFRPDHGHQMLDDLSKKTNPGYTAIGRMKGLAALQGLQKGVIKSLELT
ncbi:MAG: mannonate dehydratase [Thermonemataceae bacterium]